MRSITVRSLIRRLLQAGAAARVVLPPCYKESMACLTEGCAPRPARGRLKPAVLAPLALAALASACSPAPTASEVPGGGESELWGTLTPIVSVQELMHDLIEPAAKTLFTSVRVVIDKPHGTVEYGPKTDADWEKIRSAAVTLGEGVYLLKVARPIVPADDRDPRDATELTPPEILKKLQRDPVLWEARIQAVRNVALQAIDVAKRRDTEELWDVGENLNAACERCHLDYWYPAQRLLLKELEQKVRAAMRLRATP
jgi:hypothetical protein